MCVFKHIPGGGAGAGTAGTGSGRGGAGVISAGGSMSVMSSNFFNIKNRCQNSKFESWF